MKVIRKKLLLQLLILLLFIGTLFYGVLRLEVAAKNNLPAATCYRFLAGVAITQGQHEQLTENGIQWCAKRQDAAICSYYDKDAPVQVITTASTMGDLFYTSLIDGSWYGPEIDDERRVAVISEDLAVNFFFTKHAVGQQITLDQQQYTIVGVVKQRRSLLEKASDDGAPKVYLPAQTYDTQFTSFYLRQQGDVPFKTVSGQATASVAGLPLADGENYLQIRQLLAVFGQIAKMLVGAVALYFIAELLRALLKPRLAGQPKIAASLLVARKLAFLAYFYFSFVQILAALPRGVLNPQNVFDFSYYLKKLLTFLQRRNFYQGFAYELNFTANLLVVEVALIFLLLVFCVMTMWVLRHLIRESVKEENKETLQKIDGEIKES